MAFGLDLGNLIAHLSLDSVGFDTNLLSAQARVKSFANSLESLGRNLTLKVTLPLTVMVRKAVKDFSSFNDAMIRAAAVTEGTTSDVEKQMESMALTMSKKSVFSAKELAEGFVALGQAGYTAQQGIKALPIFVEFATAASIDMNTAVKYLDRSLNALGLSTQDPTERMKQLTRISDNLTIAAIETTGTIYDFVAALAINAGPALRYVNKSLEEGVAALMAYAKAGIVGEEAGSLLYYTMREFQRSYIHNKEMWNEIGLSVYKTGGEMRNLADILGDLENMFKGMSNEGSKYTLMMLGFQDRSLRGIQALLGFSNAIRVYQKLLETAGGDTHRISEEYLKSFHSRMLMLTHSVQNLGISVGRILSVYILKLGKEIEKVTEWWDSLNETTQLFIVKLGLILVIAGPVLIILSKMITAVAILSLGFKVLAGGVLSTVISLGVLVSAVAAPLLAIIALVAIAYTLRAAWNQGLDDIKLRMIDFIDTARRLFTEFLDTDFGKMIIYMVDTFRQAFVDIKKDSKEFFVSIASNFLGYGMWLKSMGSGLKDWLLNPTKEGVNDLATIWKKAGQTFQKAFEEAYTQIGGAEGANKYVVEKFQVGTDYLEGFLLATKEHFKDIGEALKKQFGEDVAGILPMIDKIIEKIKKVPEMDTSLIQNKEIAKVLADLERAYNEEAKSIEGVSSTLYDMVKAVKEEEKAVVLANTGEKYAVELTKFRSQAMLDFEGNLEIVEREVAKYRAELEKLDKLKIWESMTSWFNTNDISNIWKNLVDDATGSLDSLAETLKDFMVEGKADWKAFTASLLSDWVVTINKMLIKTALLNIANAAGVGFDWLKALTGAAVSGVAAGVSGASAETGTSGLEPAGTLSGKSYGNLGIGSFSALGNLFNAGNIIPMAMGSLVNSFVNRPILAAMNNGKTALMGEAGTEAVMPVTRDRSGRLGVRAEQPKVDIQNKLKIVNVLSPDEIYAAMQTTAGEKLILNTLKRNGII